MDKIKGLICHMLLILKYTVQLVIPNFCIKFQNPSHSSSREIFDGFLEAVLACTHNLCSKEKKFNLKIIILTAVKYCSILHGRVFVMESDCFCL